MTAWTLAQRTAGMNPSALWEILKLGERPGVISLAGGLPSPHTFPIDAFSEAAEHVLRSEGHLALQYAGTDGHSGLREAVARSLPWKVDPAQVLITTGSQQALDLVAKVFVDPGSRILVEAPTYLGALHAFAPMQPRIDAVASDDDGLVVEDFVHRAGNGAERARFLYVLPNFQNPTGRTLAESRRDALVQAAAAHNIPLIEDNPYGDLWFDQPPPAPLTARNPEGCIYLGTFSKVLAPGLRLGYLVAPKAVYPKLMQAKQAADLHTSSFNQHLVAQVLQGGFLQQHIPTIRALYKRQCHAMLDALQAQMQGLGVTWTRPAGGMFLWLRLPEGMDATALLHDCVQRNVAFTPGSAFYAHDGDPRTLRLSYVTATEAQIRTAIAVIADAVRTQLTARGLQRAVAHTV